MAKVDSRGLVDDGSSNLTVDGALNVGGSVQGVLPGKQNTVSTISNGATTTLTNPGYYLYDGGSTGVVSSCTASLPSAASYPGAMFMFAPVTATSGGCLLTGSAVAQNVVFSAVTGTFGLPQSSLNKGTKLTLGNSGSFVTLQSTGYNWIHVASSGSVTIS